MKKLLALFFLLGHLTFAQNTANYGISGNTGSSTGSANFFVGNFITVNTALNVTSGFIYVGAGGSTGSHTDLIITPATNYTTQGTTVSCHATITNPGGTVNALVSFTFSGCTIAAGVYFIGYDTADTTIAIGSYSGVGATCLAPSATTQVSANMCDLYVAQTYGTYTGLTAGMAGTETQQRTIYIVGTSTVINSVSKKLGTF